MGHHEPCHPSQEGSQPVSYFSTPEYDELWQEAEQKTAVLLDQIQPSRHSEKSRKAFINYIQSLVERELDCKIFSFGSVPLKTYLPDGDIDLTAISRHGGLNDDWAKKVTTVLERDEHIYKSEFHVKEVKCISAEVPVVKCLVENIIVDITFNQLGGLSTLCFLEEIDTLIDRDHLFKRSIILIKAWCFYESRILGAHHGLLSTYALEVLVLYIFHVFHHSLRGPLEVLFRFLQYFSKFDWEQNCLSLWGSVPLGLLPSRTEGPLHSSNASFLLSEDFVKECREKYSSLAEINHAKSFSPKFMNLMDPLRPFNNLGRSVNSGNLVRIYRAFTLGATQLERLLQGPKEQVSESLATFFRNTHKHCRGQHPDAGVFTLRDNSPAPCNGKLNEEAISGVVALSNGLADGVSLKSEDADGAFDRPACRDTDCPKWQGYDGSDSTDRFQPLETRDTDAAAILKGDHETYFQNLKDGLLYQNCGNCFRVWGLQAGGSVRKGLGRPLFFDGRLPSSDTRKNEPIYVGGSHGGPNNGLLDSLPKHHRGTGTFFPNVKPTVERDRRIYSNGVNRSQRNIDLAQSFSNNTSEAFKSRSHMPKRREGTSRPKFRKNMDFNEQRNFLTEDNVVKRPTMETMQTTEHSLLCQGDSEPFADYRLTDWSPRSLDSAISSSPGTSKDLPLDKLEFGSFGPGILTKGFQKSPHAEQVDSFSVKQHTSPRGAMVESQARASKTGDKVDHQQMSVYQLKDEDFPPLCGANHQELAGIVAAERNASSSQGLHHQARHLSRSPKATEVAQNR